MKILWTFKIKMKLVLNVILIAAKFTKYHFLMHSCLPFSILKECANIRNFDIHFSSRGLLIFLR